MKQSTIYFLLAAIYIAPHISSIGALFFGGAFTVTAVILLFVET